MTCHDITEGISGMVIRRWEEAGQPDWTLEHTMREVKLADSELERDGLGKVNKRVLRAAIQRGDEIYVETWT